MSHIDQSMTGHVSAGGPAGTSPSTSTPAWSSRSAITTTIVESTSTTSAHGTTGSNRRPSSRIATETTEIASETGFVVPRPDTRPTTLSTNSPPESIDTPSIFATWLTRMSSARPPTKPTRIGFERKFARKPSFSTASSRNRMPQMIAWAIASVA